MTILLGNPDNVRIMERESKKNSNVGQLSPRSTNILTSTKLQQ